MCIQKSASTTAGGGTVIPVRRLLGVYQQQASMTAGGEIGIPVRRQLGVYQQQASTKVWCERNIPSRRQLGVYSTIGLDNSLVWNKHPLSTTAWCVFNNRPRRRSLFDYAFEYRCACCVYVFAVFLPKITPITGNLYQQPSSEYPLLVQGRRVDPSWVFLARSRVTVMPK